MHLEKLEADLRKKIIKNYILFNIFYIFRNTKLSITI